MAWRFLSPRSSVEAETKIPVVVQHPPEGWPGARRPLPDERESVTHEFTIYAAAPSLGDAPSQVVPHRYYIHVGLYPEGKPGELFVYRRNNLDTGGAFLDAMGIAFSIALQYGAPVDAICPKLVGQRFYPEGRTDSKEIPRALSPVDYIGRFLLLRYGRKD